MKLLRLKNILIVSSFLLVAGSLLACKEETTTTTADIIVETEAIIPAIDNPDTVFYSGAGIEITYGELYREFKINDGINQLLIMVDSLLLADYLDAVSAEEILEKRDLMTYGFADPDLIGELSIEAKAEKEAKYEESMFLAGYGDDDEPYLRLMVAKDKYATSAMKAEANDDKSWYVGPETIATYYTNNYDRSMTAIKIKFTSESDAKEVMRSLNLVGRVGGKLYRYIGDRPISEIPSSGFNDTNTILLEDEELLEAFMEMYNAVYGVYRTPLDPDGSYQDLIGNPDLSIDYSVQAKASTTLASLMFSTFITYEEHLEGDTVSTYYTNNPIKHYSANDSSYYMFINLKRADKADLTDFSGSKTALEALIGEDVYAEIETTLVDGNLRTSYFVSNRLTELRQEHDFQIFDYFLGIDYMMIDFEFEPDETGHESNLAAFDDTTITAEEFFTFALARNPALSLLYAAQMPYLIDNYFAGMYCVDDTVCEYDMGANTSAKMELHREALAELKEAYEQSSYISYYSFEEYIYIAYGAASEDDMLELYYVKSALQPFAIYGLLEADSWKLLTDHLALLVDEAYENYFSLNVNHLLIFVDRNEDGTPDDYEAFVSSQADAEAYATLIEAFQEAIVLYLNEETTNTFPTLITTFNRAKRTDETWGEFKNYGFYLMTENLSTSGSLTYANAKDVYAETFVAGMIAAYKEYNLETNIDKTKLLYETFVDTAYGSHLMLVAKGTAFQSPSAKFTMTFDDDLVPEYTIGIENDEDELSLSQMKIYAEYRFLEMIYGTDADFLEAMDVTLPKIPAAVKTAIQTFFGNIYDSVYVVGTLNAIIAEVLQSGELVDDDNLYSTLTTQTMNQALAKLGEIYFKQVFTGYEPEDS